MNKPLKTTKPSTSTYTKSKARQRQTKTSILDDIDFEVELIHKDLINVAYIIKLLAKLKQTKTSEAQKQKKPSWIC
jgi:type I restriction enzyme R subunit